MTAQEELVKLQAERNRQYWLFTRTARGKPVDPALTRRIHELEEQMKDYRPTGNGSFGSDTSTKETSI